MKSLLFRSVYDRRSKFAFLPKKDFFLQIKSVQNVMCEKVCSMPFLESSHFDGHACRKVFNRSLRNNDLSLMYKVWPLIRATVFKVKWSKL